MDDQTREGLGYVLILGCAVVAFVAVAVFVAGVAISYWAPEGVSVFTLGVAIVGAPIVAGATFYAADRLIPERQKSVAQDNPYAPIGPVGLLSLATPVAWVFLVLNLLK